VGSKPETFTQKMKRKIDSIKGRLIYSRYRLVMHEEGIYYLGEL
jgi:hypothetical protein